MLMRTYACLALLSCLLMAVPAWTTESNQNINVNYHLLVDHERNLTPAAEELETAATVEGANAFVALYKKN
jgi:hypothetical protein